MVCTSHSISWWLQSLNVTFTGPKHFGGKYKSLVSKLHTAMMTRHLSTSVDYYPFHTYLLNISLQSSEYLWVKQSLNHFVNLSAISLPPGSTAVFGPSQHGQCLEGIQEPIMMLKVGISG